MSGQDTVIPFIRPEEGPVAIVRGSPLTELPQDLYIPPDALEVFLEAFEGPLDLLLYLIKRQNLDVLDIPIAEITAQYIEYIELMKLIKLELAADYLLMAAMLAEIKSRMLLPRPAEETDEDDPRAELIRRLQEYERFKKAAEDIDALPRVGRDTFEIAIEPPENRVVRLPPKVNLKDMIEALRDVLHRAEMYKHHHIRLEPLSVRERMTSILDVVREEKFRDFVSFFTPEEGKLGVVVTLLAILELLKESLIDIVQSEPFAPIYLKAPEKSDEPTDEPAEA